MRLIIEVTRKCNLECEHCLRGDPENLDIDTSFITTTLEQLKDEYLEVTFTGGEPTLNLAAIQHTIDEIRRLNIVLSSFYIATNGNDLSINFASVCLQLYALAAEKEMCSVALSADDHHEYIPDDDLSLISGLSFFSKRDEDRNYFTKNGYGIRQGRFADYGIGRELTPAPIITTYDLMDTEVYLNAKGTIINGCDWSYETQDNNQEVYMCSCQDLSSFISSLTSD